LPVVGNVLLRVRQESAEPLELEAERRLPVEPRGRLDLAEQFQAAGAAQPVCSPEHPDVQHGFGSSRETVAGSRAGGPEAASSSQIWSTSSFHRSALWSRRPVWCSRTTRRTARGSTYSWSADDGSRSPSTR